MPVAFFTLLLMYASLLLLYVFQREVPPRVDPWPRLQTEDLLPDAASDAPCRVDDDCPPHHVCLGNVCVPQLLRGGKCRPETGDWTALAFQGRTFAVCACKDHGLFTQKHLGGDCDVPAACGFRGTYDVRTRSCVCEPGYEAAGLECRKAPALAWMATLPCRPADEVEVARLGVADGFHAEYADVRLKPAAKCAKRPCSFDALSGRPLKHAKHEPGWGCVCDPSRGLFGVVLRGAGKKYLSTEGFDACASVFDRDPQAPVSVEHVTYFYLGDREPLSLVAFDLSTKEDGLLAPVFRGRGGRFAVRQSPWRYDYAQHFFRSRPGFRARLRKARRLEALDLSEVDDHLFDDRFEPQDCGTLKHAPRGAQPASLDEAYRLLYANPVCRVADPAGVDPRLWHRVVLNPNFLTYDEHRELPRYNAFVLRYDAEGLKKWTLDLDHAYEVDRFARNRSNVPIY